MVTTEAGDMHPTGMHTYLVIILIGVELVSALYLKSKVYVSVLKNRKNQC